MWIVGVGVVAMIPVMLLVARVLRPAGIRTDATPVLTFGGLGILVIIAGLLLWMRHG
jgi:hypothetical protein